MPEFPDRHDFSINIIVARAESSPSLLPRPERGERTFYWSKIYIKLMYALQLDICSLFRMLYILDILLFENKVVSVSLILSI